MSEVLVHVPTVTNLDDEDREPSALNRVDHTVVPNAQPIEPILTMQQLDPWRAGVLAQSIDLPGDLSLSILWESSEFLPSGLEELDGVGQAGGSQPQVSLHLLPRHPDPVLRISQRLAGCADVQVVF